MMRGSVVGGVLGMIALVLAGCVGYRNLPRAGQAGTATPIAAAPVVITAADIDAWYRRTDGWRFPEATFHLLSDLLATHGPSAHITLDAEALAELRRRLRGAGYFPGEALTRVELADGRLRVGLDADRNIPVGTAFGQVALAVTRVLEFAIEPHSESSAPSIRLRVLTGGIRINFGWLLRSLLSKPLPDVQVETIDCDIDAGRRQGTLIGQAWFRLPRSGIDWRRADGQLIIDLLHPDLPWGDDLVISASSASLWKRRIWKRDGNSEVGPSDEQVDRALADPETLIRNGIEAAMTLEYGMDPNGRRLIDAKVRVRLPNSASTAR